MKRVVIIPALALLTLQQGCSLRSPESTVRHFFVAAARGELDDAISYLSAGALALGRDQLRGYLGEVARDAASRGGLQHLEVENLTVAGQTASAATTLRFGNGAVAHKVVPLIEEDHQWKIDLREYYLWPVVRQPADARIGAHHLLRHILHELRDSARSIAPHHGKP